MARIIILFKAIASHRIFFGAPQAEVKETSVLQNRVNYATFKNSL